jgi:serine/threonine protein kinase
MSEDNFHKQNTLPGSEGEESEIPPVPKQIGEYKIESLFSKGGMSLIFLGIHPTTSEPVVIKVLSPKYVSHQDVIERFISEAEIIKLTDHPNIVKLYGHGKWEEGLYIAMEYIQGASLRLYMQYNPVSIKRALEIILEVAYALCHLHTHSIIHRDLKLENILITETGNVKLIDFGIAHTIKDSADLSPPIKQRLIGTPIYMSPEQRENPERVSYPSDIYSLGIIAYELVLGKLSHGQIHLGLMPKGLQKILAKTLQPNPEDRYQDVVDFITDISAYLNSTSLQNERREGDILSELSDQLQSAQSDLVPSKAPSWPCVETGVSYHKGLSIAGIYYDFFTLCSNRYGIIVIEPTQKGIEGVVNLAFVRGMLRSLNKISQDPVTTIKMLNDLLIEDTRNRTFTLSYLVLLPEENLFRYITCGQDSLLYVPADNKNPLRVSMDNVVLGLDSFPEYKIFTHSWEMGDLLIMNKLSNLKTESPTSQEFNQDHFKTLLIENVHLPPQKQVDTIMRRVRGAANKSFEKESTIIISILRKE